MNLVRPSIAAISYVFRFWLALRKLMPRRKCKAFGVQGMEALPAIDKIYVINLDREPGRWSKMKQELKYILDSSGIEILGLTERYAAVDANQFSQQPKKDDEINPFYTLFPPKLGGWGGKMRFRARCVYAAAYQGGQGGSSAKSIFYLIITSYLIPIFK